MASPTFGDIGTFRFLVDSTAILSFAVEQTGKPVSTFTIGFDGEGEGGDGAFAGYQTYRNLFWLETTKAALGPFAKPASGFMAAVGELRPFQRIARFAPLMRTQFKSY